MNGDSDETLHRLKPLTVFRPHLPRRLYSTLGANLASATTSSLTSVEADIQKNTALVAQLVAASQKVNK